MEVDFSRRLDWQRGENALARAEARARARGTLLDLTVSNPTRVGLPDTGDALAAALAGAGAAIYDPTPRGPAEARRAIADAYAAAGAAIDPDRLILTASSSESYAYLFKLLADPGDLILVPEPSYPLFDYLARLEGLATAPYRLSYEGDWHLDLDSVDAAFERARRDGRRIRAVVVVSPNNPTGSILRDDECAALDRRATAAGCAIIADEVFADYAPASVHAGAAAPTHVRCLAARPTHALTFSLGGLSKSCGLPQLKLGWIAAGGPAAFAAAALDRLELVADTYLSVGTPVARALPALLTIGASMRAAIRARLDENRRVLDRALVPGSPIDRLDGGGGWSTILRVPAIRTDEEWALALLERDDTLVQPGYFFDLRGGVFLVVSLIAAPDVFAEGMRRLIVRIDEDATPRPPFGSTPG